jgi:hypothetical protein
MDLLVSTRKGLFTFSERDGNWELRDHAFVGVAVTLTLHDRRDGARYAALNHGHFGPKLHRLDAGAGEWVELAVPEHPVDTVINPNTGQAAAAATQLLWSLAAGHRSQPGRLWCGTIPGGLFRSDDRGGSWSLVRSLWDRPERAEWFGGGYDSPGIHSIVTRDDDPDDVVVGVSCGGAWRTIDDGGSWHLGVGMQADFMPPERIEDPRIQDPHRIVRCAAVPEVLWTQHHNGIFRSTDGGDTWHRFVEVEPSTFGFAVAVDPTNPDRAWFVPADNDTARLPVDGAVVVSTTGDGGRSWSVLREGLPGRMAFDLVYRHSLSVDATGSVLAMGSTTGSLWSTTDGGRRWRALDAHLPPILAVELVS